MMARTLFEDVVVSYWMTYIQSEDWVVDRLADRRRYGQLLHRDVALKYFSKEQLNPDKEIGAAKLAALQRDTARLSAMFGRYGEAFWWANDVKLKEQQHGQPRKWKTVRPSRSLNSLVAALERAGAERANDGALGHDHVMQPPLPDGYTVLRGYMGIAHSFNNMLMHHSEFGLNIHASGVTGGNKQGWNEDPSSQWVPQIEVCLYWTYGQMIILMCDRLRPDLVAEASHLFAGTLQSAWPVGAPTN